MSAGPDPRVDTQVIEQERRRLSRRLDEVARMCEANLPPATFYGEMLKRLLESLAAPAGVVWTRTAQGNLQQQFQVNLKEVNLDRSDATRQAHEELLRLAVTQPRPLHLPPQSSLGPSEPGKPAPGNPSDYLLLMVPILQNEQVSGLIEVWQGANRPPGAVPGFLQYMTLMAELCTRYQRNQMIGQLSGQQQLWSQLEAFTRQIHSSLNPTEVAYQVANEGRRMIECDRVSVAVRRGYRTAIDAVSGADVVEKRSALVRAMRKLSEAVLDWGEKLVFAGTKEEGLPPKVLEALDAYLAESPSQLLVVLPLRPPLDDKDKEKGKERKPAKSAVVMECFEAPPDPQQPIARLDVIGQHACSALGNAVEHQRIPLRFLWQPIAKVQEGLGGKARSIGTLVFVALALLGSAMYLMPYPLKMEAAGKLQPHVRVTVYPAELGRIESFDVKPGDVVGEGRVLARMYHRDVQSKLVELEAKRDEASLRAASLAARARNELLLRLDRAEAGDEAQLQREIAQSKAREIKNLVDRAGAMTSNPGYFTLSAPAFTESQKVLLRRPWRWTVLNGNFVEEWTGREAKPSDPILRLGARDGPWEIELKIPQKHIGQVLRAYEREDVKELDIDFLVWSAPTRVFKGKLARHKIAGEAVPDRESESKDEADPVVLAFVRVTGDDIPADDQLPEELLLSGADVKAKVRCGDHRMGYSLFYGVWEFLYEQVWFRFF
jgi:hypothetical protein